MFLLLFYLKLHITYSICLNSSSDFEITIFMLSSTFIISKFNIEAIDVFIISLDLLSKYYIILSSMYNFKYNDICSDNYFSLIFFLYKVNKDVIEHQYVAIKG